MGGDESVPRSWQEEIEWLQLYTQLRDQLLESLNPEDLHFKAGGDNPSLGEQCLIIGEIQRSYLDSFQTFTQDFEYRYPEPSLAGDLTGLKDWFADLDRQLFDRLAAFPKEVVEQQTIDRGQDFIVDFKTQLDIYREALIIFYGKVSVYLKAMEKELPARWAHWIE